MTTFLADHFCRQLVFCHSNCSTRSKSIPKVLYTVSCRFALIAVAVLTSRPSAISPSAARPLFSCNFCHMKITNIVRAHTFSATNYRNSTNGQFSQYIKSFTLPLSLFCSRDGTCQDSDMFASNCGGV